MSEWREIIEEGVVYHVNEECGNIVTVEDRYVAMLPKVCKLGPFNSLEEAKQVLSSEDNRQALDQMLDAFNQNLMTLVENARKE